ncbi:MAG: hypothetical protein ABSG63_00405 [Spirochaetia bacterium]|jgi:hypothetical protein
MSSIGWRVVGVISIVLSLASAAYGATWFANGRIKHGLLFAAIFVLLFLFGLVSLRAKGKTAEQVQPK